MKKIIKLLHPSYLDEFKCIGGECEDNCCVGWDVDIDKITFKQYSEIDDNEIKVVIKDNVFENKNCTNENADYGKVKLNKEKRCPFLNDKNYCNIQCKLGENYLSKVCTSFPRIINKIDDQYEMSLDVACPEAARLILSKEEGLELAESEKIFNKYIINDEIETNLDEESWLNYFKEIRGFSIKIIKDRNFTLSERLYILGDFIENLEYVDYETDDVNEFIKEYDVALARNSYKKDNLNYIFQVSFLNNMIKSLDIVNEIDSETFKRYTRQVLNGINAKDNYDIEKNADKYIYEFEYYIEKYVNENDYIFENYLVNFMYNNLFPFSEGEYMFDAYIMLLIRYSLMRFYLIGMHLDNQIDSRENIIKFIQVFAKAIEHDKNYLEEILEYIKENEFDNMEFASMIL